jgi:hypothetical protein
MDFMQSDRAALFQFGNRLALFAASWPARECAVLLF